MSKVQTPGALAPIELRFDGKVALITGAGSGIGYATATTLAAAGARIVAVDRNQDKLIALIAALPGADHIMLEMDLRPADAAINTVAHAIEAAGAINILVNSAGVCHFNRMSEITPGEWDEVLEIDVRSLFFMSTAAAEQMSSGGRIINLGSNAGRKGRALSAHYAAAKAAVSNLTESLALAYGSKGITANCVCPAVTDTPMWDGLFAELASVTGKSATELTEAWAKSTPLGRLGKADDVANLIAFLASDRAAFITGQTINVCGGFMLTC
ncbi:MAG: SDR family NAD(P)-dependent oxidoreductase [Candidatus Sumerlaeaceae bacterium]